MSVRAAAAAAPAAIIGAALPGGGRARMVARWRSELIGDVGELPHRRVLRPLRARAAQPAPAKAFRLILQVICTLANRMRVRKVRAAGRAFAVRAARVLVGIA